MNPIDIALLGIGNVGRAFADYIGRMQDNRLRLQIPALADSSGALFIENADQLKQILQHKAAGHRISELPAPPITTNAREFIDLIAAAGIHVLVESLPTNLADGQPALDLINAALSAGIHVVTVDKGPLVHGFEALQQTAQTSGTRLGLTGTTGVSIPDELASEKVIEIRGVLNGTTNYILSEMQERSASFSDALFGAQASGVAEPDPSLDVDGWDTVVKTLILAKALMGATTKLDEVSRIGISAETDELICIGKSTNRVVRLVGRARIHQGRVRVSVAPKLIGEDSPFYNVRGTSKLAIFRTASKREVISPSLSGRDVISQTMVDDICRVLQDPVEESAGR